ncbi:lysozyme inhibitor LprI family protein [Neisseriaceae bacterium ESL0693]|nr:lysozyme inhibitor LprI family protein [Neisseriaceae bacterium ESL0693]
MQYRLIIGALVTTFAITACSKHESEQPVQTLNCDQPQLTDQIQRQLQQNIMLNARQFAQNDTRHFVDADKIIAAASQLTVKLQPSQADSNQADQRQCHGQLTVTIPDAILQQAQTNAPLLFGQTSLSQQLSQQIQQTDIKFNDHSFIQNLTYPAQNSTAASAPAAQATEVNLLPLSQLLQTTLLPYGVKDILVINGKTYSRADAQALLFNQTPLSHEAQMASAVLNGNNSQSTLTQETDNSLNDSHQTPTDDPSQQTVSDNDLQQARDNQRNASNEMERLWQSLDQTIQATLTNEQQHWQTQRKQQCQKPATAASSAKEAEFNYLQCDTRLINQRLQYLRGFSLS